MMISSTALRIAPIFLLVLANCSRDRAVKQRGRGIGESPSSSPGLSLAKQPFYEDNATYIDDGNSDHFWKISTPADQGIDEAKLQVAEQVLEKTPSLLSFLVVRNGFLVRESYFHGSAANHSNNIHSASKGIVSALVGIALQKKLIHSLDQHLNKLLPQFAIQDPKKKNITLRHLLTMTAGFTWEEDETEYLIENQNNWIQSIIDLPLDSSPGRRFNYSTGQSHLVSAVLSKATGQPIKAFAERYLFSPLGIKIQHWGRDPQGFGSGGYNVYMTPRSLAKFGFLVASGGSYLGKQIIEKAWLSESIQPAHVVDHDWRYGYYWWLTKMAGYQVQKLWGYGGQFVYLVPEQNLMIVMTSNTHEVFEEFDGDAFLNHFVLPALETKAR